MKIAASALVLVLLSGCSLAFTRPPPYQWDPEHPPRCEPQASAIPVGGDFALGLGDLALGGVLIGSAVSGYQSSQESTAIAASVGGLFLALAGLHGWSGVTGINRGQACRDAHDEWAPANRAWREQAPQREAIACGIAKEKRTATAKVFASHETRCDAAMAEVECADKCVSGVAVCMVALCMREFECASGPCKETERSKELQVAIDRLALETSCDRKSISVISQAEWRAGTETAFRLGACSSEYICTVAAGRVNCKPAMASVPAQPASP